ncbi:unnamed protein product [Adineta steineri]|uniref:GPI inositol-deacylase n=1 Tax=Adineta steineri TaxID=433720 RepID=A0A814NHV3_9BILA|nr:unnamed protein product [Adineta steineri]CAF1093143.1 unnamed protein product [Adineta steineri]
MASRIILPIVQNLFFLLTISLFFLGIVAYFFRHESNYCEMTYMFENPTYHRISMPDDIEIRYRRYGLYSYCEGSRCELHRQNVFTGSPVLFIIGNADSYRQVRSLGSVAYRMGDKPNHLDFFSIDFNEELSALFGGVLEQQTEFVAYAIKQILSLYKTEKTIILVGNSIGGLLSRAVFLQPSKRFDPNTVRLIITQATPHQAPVIHSDNNVIEFYSRVNNYWKNEWNNSLQHLVLVSLAGGDRDHLVRSDLCSLNGLTDESRSIDVLTSSVPHVWTSTDHRCIVWCRQLVLTTTRALLEIIQDKKQHPQQFMKILKKHFFPTIDFNLGHNTTLNSKTEPILITESSTSVTGKNQHDYLIRLKDAKFHTIIIHSTKAKIFLKNDNNIIDITKTLIPIPPTYSDRKMIRFNLKKLDHDIKKYDSILIHLEHVKSQADIYQIENSEQTVELSTFGSQTLSFKKTGYVKLVFPTLTHLWQVYNVYLSSNNEQIPLIHFHVPWSNEDLYNLVSLRSPSEPSKNLPKSLHRQMRLKLHRLPQSSSNNNQYPSLELFLDPNSSYTLEINYSFLDILSQLIRYYIFLLPTFLFTVLCISYSLQMNDTRLRVYQTMLAWQIHLPIALLISILYKIIIEIFPSANFVVNIHSNGYYFFCLPLIMYFLALSIWAMISFIIDYLILDFVRELLNPALVLVHSEIHQQTKYVHLIQWVILILPLLTTVTFSGSNGHITLFILALIHVVWRGTLNRRLREILTTLLLFHGLLVALNLTGFIVHVKTVFAQGLLPLYIIMSDPSFLSAICCIGAFYLRFILDRTHLNIIQKIKTILYKHNRLILVSLALISQFCCSYSMYYLWILISFIFIHAAVIFFVPIHQE